MWTRWLSFVLGVWLFVSPLVFNYAEPSARFNSAIVGLAVAIVSMLASSAPKLRYVNVALGGWMLLAPNLLGYGGSGLPTAHDIVLGALIICVAVGPTAQPTVRGFRRLIKT